MYVCTIRKIRLGQDDVLSEMSFSLGGEIIAKAIAKGLEVKSIQNGSDNSIHTYIQHIETKHTYIHTGENSGALVNNNVSNGSVCTAANNSERTITNSLPSYLRKDKGMLCMYVCMYVVYVCMYVLNCG